MENKTLVGLHGSRWRKGTKPSFKDEVGYECVWRGLISIDVDMSIYLSNHDDQFLHHFEPPMETPVFQIQQEMIRRQTIAHLLGKKIDSLFPFPIETKPLHLREINGKGLEMITDSDGNALLMFYVAKTNTVISLPFAALVKRYSLGFPKVCKAPERYTTTTVEWLLALKQAIELNLEVIPFDFNRYHQPNVDEGIYPLLESFLEDYASQPHPFPLEVQHRLREQLDDLEETIVHHMEVSMTRQRGNMYVHFLEHAFDKSIFQNPLFNQNKIIQAYRFIRKKLHLYFHGHDSEFNEDYFLKINGKK